MPLYKSNLPVLDRQKPLELVLELNSFSGGENTIGTDRELKNNEARAIENWDALSVGGMIRSKGFNEVADGGASYTDALDLLIQHNQSGSTKVYGVVEGDLIFKDSASFSLDHAGDAAAFTSGTLCGAVSAGDALWITNSTDNLVRKVNSAAAAVPAGVPTNARDRIHHSKFRLIAEGGGPEVYGSRAGSGNWNSANTWSLANDAFNITMPDDTYGFVPNFPSGTEDLVFTKFKAYALFNYPDVAYRAIPNSRGCAAGFSVAKGDEGVFFFSDYPTKGIFLYNGIDWIQLTINHDFVDDVNLAQRIFGVYRNKQYYFFYNETGSGVTYPNRLKIYNTKFGRWMTRPVNDAVSDNFGYPTLLKYDNNELYVGSSQKDKMYELETTDNSDEGENTEANYKTKDFTSSDFSVASGSGQFPIDEVRMKLTKMTVSYYGSTGSFSILWTADRGKNTGQQVITMSVDGPKLNVDFTLNTSKLNVSPQVLTKTLSFNNSAVGRRFNFQILNNATGERCEIKSIKIHAIAIEEV